MAPDWSASLCLISKTLHPRRAMSYTLQNLTPRTSTPSSPFHEPVFQHSEKPCEDDRPQQRGALTETPPVAGCEPNWTVEDRDCRHFTGDGQFTELEDLRVKPVSFHQSIIASTCDSAESIMGRPESDFDDDSERENLMSTSSQCPTSTRKLVAVFSSQNRLNQNTFSHGDELSFRHQQVFLGGMNLSSDSLTRKMLRNLFLMETDITCLLKRDLNSWTRNTKLNLLSLAFVNFGNKLMLSNWNWRTPVSHT